MVAGVGKALSEAVGCKSNELGLRVNKIYFLWSLWLTTAKATETALTRLACVLLGLDAV